MFAKELEKFGIDKSPVLDLIQANFDIYEVKDGNYEFSPENGYTDVIRIVSIEKRGDIYINVRDSDKNPTYSFYGHKGMPWDDDVLESAKWYNESEELSLIQKMIDRGVVATLERC